ncbi:MAG: N-acetyltransferase [Pirellulales bacterium]|nr:N-acetyltransferase [Pirellulales bacterium]
MIIRPERADDYDAIRGILIAAFTDHQYSHQTEHLIVEVLRTDGALTVGLVAEVEGKVVGHIAFSTIKIDGKECQWFALGPIGVAPELQRKGIGKRLVEEGLEAIRDLGARGCFLVGEPEFYGRFGFRSLPVLTMEGIPQQNCLALPLVGEVPEGRVMHHKAFFVGEETGPDSTKS